MFCPSPKMKPATRPEIISASNSSLTGPSQSATDDEKKETDLTPPSISTTNSTPNTQSSSSPPHLTNVSSAPERRRQSSGVHHRSHTMPNPRSQTMKTLFCIRHAESEYNLRVRSFSTWIDPSFWKNGFDPLVRDPQITETGHGQVSVLASRLAAQNFLVKESIEMIVVSPLQRALQTCMGVFEPSFQNLASSSTLPPTIPIYALPVLREWMDTSGDLGRERSELEPEFPQVNFSLVPEEGVWWYPASSPHAGDTVVKESSDDVQARTVEFLEWASQRPEATIAVVGHSRFFRLMVGARKKLPNCGMMKVIVDGQRVISWTPIA